MRTPLLLITFTGILILGLFTILVPEQSKVSVPPAQPAETDMQSTTDSAVTTYAEVPAPVPEIGSTPTPNNTPPRVEPIPTPSTSTMPATPPPQATPAPQATLALAGLRVMAWVYPGEPGCNAVNEFTDGRRIDVLKPEFFTVNGGSLTLITTGCNAYSQSFVPRVKRASTQQFVTISSSNTGDMERFLASALSDTTDITTLVSFLVTNDLTGIELNFEDFGSWSPTTYQNFKEFVTRLGTALHAEGKQLMLVGPAISNNIEQGWFAWRYEDFADLPVDHMVVMAYDYQFDHGVGEPVAPLDWIAAVTTWASARYPSSRLTIGVPSYGYEGKAGARPLIRTYDQLKSIPGFATAPRDARSAERMWKVGNTTYVYQDTESIRQKIYVIETAGIRSISIWHLGGNRWY